MYIMLGVFVFTLMSCLAFIHWHPMDDTTWISDLLGSLVVATVVALSIGGSTWSILYVTLQDEVDVEWALAEGPNGQYLENGTSGEYNSATIIAYYRDGGAIRQFHRSAGSSAVATSDDGRAYAFLTCPSATTLPEWLKRPWGEDDEPECDREFITYYLPEGES